MARVQIGSLLVLLVVGCNSQRAADSPSNNSEQSDRPVHSSADTPNALPASDPSQPAQVKVFLNPLVMLLAGAERQRGRPLTREEVLDIRDKAAFVMMSPEQASKFYKSLDAQVPVHRMNPDRVWEEWQEIRSEIK